MVCVAPRDQGHSDCRAACLQSMQHLGVSYLDLYLVHWPGAQGMKPEDPRHPQLRKGSWEDMEQLYKEGMWAYGARGGPIPSAAYIYLLRTMGMLHREG